MAVPLSDRNRLTIAAIGYAQQQLSEGQAVGRLSRRFGQFTTDELLAAYGIAVQAVAAGQTTADLDQQADIGLAYGPNLGPEQNVAIDATVTWSVDETTDQTWVIREYVKAGDSVKSIMDRLEAIADTRNQQSGRGEQRRSVTIDFVLPL